MTKSEVLGTQPIGKLLAQQAIPASIGFAVMSMNMVVDTIFVGKYIGDLAISAISIVVPISFFMSGTEQVRCGLVAAQRPPQSRELLGRPSIST